MEHHHNLDTPCIPPSILWNSSPGGYDFALSAFDGIIIGDPSLRTYTATGTHFHVPQLQRNIWLVILCVLCFASGVHGQTVSSLTISKGHINESRI